MDLLMDLLTVLMDLLTVLMVITDHNSMVLPHTLIIIRNVECTADSMDTVDLTDTEDPRCPNILATEDLPCLNILVMVLVLVEGTVTLEEEPGWSV